MKKTLTIAAIAAWLVAWAFVPGKASSHREAPLISQDPQADGTDVYAFVSPDRPDTVTLITSWLPFENPGRWTEFLQVRRQRPLRDQDRQHR